ncbi:putative dehydrogenase [Microbacterium sp. W4I4]|uniref:Gfo/Idh/MocA family protein n=1 Tax=Microbacterium sp. W4I4 TaxID=3042295 RepID=UPI002787A242|nr:Gfo/Idh/MocA family oxidoreductase [Microbacterium sp. W4I4]MDQ0614073.1 putative dehydrogenase [Microbacterium sp. W4I4]
MMTSANVVPVFMGSGLIAHSHARALVELGHRPAVVWSPRADSRDRFARAWGAVSAPSIEAAMDTAGATHVHICTTPMNHNEPIRAAAARALTIVSEKPLAPTGALAQDAFDAVQGTPTEAWLNFNRRMDEGIQLLRSIMAKGTIGTAVSVNGHYRQQWNATPTGLDWRLDPKQVGPSRTITEIGSHWLDLAAFVLGARITAASGVLGYGGPREYVTDTDRGMVNPPNDDFFASLLTFESGAVGQVYGTQLAHGAFDEIELRIDATRGSAVWSSEHPNLLRFGNKTEGMRTVGIDSPTRSLSASISAIYQGTAPEQGVATFLDGVNNARAIDAVLASARTRAWVDV